MGIKDILYIINVQAVPYVESKRQPMVHQCDVHEYI